VEKYALGNCHSTFWRQPFPALGTQQTLGPGVAPAAALAQDPPAAWCLTPLALAIEALALSCRIGLWGVGVRHEGIAGKGVENAINLAPTGLLSQNF